MKRNHFGEPILQPGDDIGLAFMETYETDIDETLTAFEIDNDPNFGWTATIRDENFNEIQVHDFEDRGELVTYLEAANVRVEA